MCELYGLSDDPNPSIDVYPVFHCGCVDLGSKAVVKHLMAELRLRQDVTRHMRQLRQFILTVIWLPGSRSIKIISNSYRRNLSKDGTDKETSIMR